MIPLLAADPTVTQLRWRSGPELWLVVLVILPLVLGFAWWIYRREAETLPRRVKPILATIRAAVVLCVLLVLFEPYAETSVQKTVRANLVVLLDTSASMTFADRYSDEALAGRLAEFAELPADRPIDETPRIDLVRGVLGNRTLGVLDRMRERFVLHVYTFDQELRPLWAESGVEDEAPGGDSSDGGDPVSRVREIGADGRLSRIGDALDLVLEEFRLRDEPLAGVVLVSDGRRHGGSADPAEAARKATTFRTAVPIHTVLVGDPEESRNIQIRNLRAKEYVLAKDQLTIEFTVRATGYGGRIVPVRLSEVVGEGGEIPLAETELRLPADGEEAPGRIAHRFDRAGSILLRVSIPVQAGEKVTNDNAATHPLRVIDRRIKVLYVEGYPRHEYKFLVNALTRDVETLEAQVLLLSASPGYVNFSTPGVDAVSSFPHSRRELEEYDVIFLGDVDWKDLAPDVDGARKDLENLRAFVEAGGGLAMVSGEFNAPRLYQNTPLQAVIPVLIDQETESRFARQDTETSTNVRLTPTGLVHPIMQLEDDPDRSRTIWEEDGFSAFFWYYPSPRAKEIARVLAEHPRDRTRDKPHPIFVTMRYGRGRVFWSAIDELWRLRWVYEDRYYRRFWGEVVRDLATYKLQGGNRRFKIFTEDLYHVGENVTIRASVLDADYEPSKKEAQAVTLRSPGGEETEVELLAVPERPGNFRRVIRASRRGTYLVTADDPALEGERPEKTFQVIHASGEMRDPLPDPVLMESVASLSGGRTLDLTGLGELADEIPARTLRVPTDIRPDDLWDSAWTLLLVVGLLAAEWLLRKRFRLL